MLLAFLWHLLLQKDLVNQVNLSPQRNLEVPEAQIHLAVLEIHSRLYFHLYQVNLDFQLVQDFLNVLLRQCYPYYLVILVVLLALLHRRGPIQIFKIGRIALSTT